MPLRPTARWTLVTVMVAVLLVAACSTGAPPTTLPTTPPTTPGSPGPVEPAPIDRVTGRYVVDPGPLDTLWVDPVAGQDSRPGTTPELALRTLAEAWNRIPAGTPLTRGVRIVLRPGTHPESSLPNYLEHRHGTAAAPILIESERGPGTSILGGDLNVFDVDHLVLTGIDIVWAGDSFHCEQCRHLVIRNSRMWAGGSAHEVVKVNQSQHVYIEDSDLGGADDNVVDFVAVQHGHLRGNDLHDAGDWCAYVKGGSHDIVVDGNEIHECGTGGFTAGQGTGFEFMVAPWLHHEASGITVTNNVVHDTDGAGLGVNGGAHVLFAHNTLVRVGARSHVVEFVHGGRGCDGDMVACRARRALGGWGSDAAEGQFIPNRDIAFIDNVIWNPPGHGSAWQHVDVRGAVAAPVASGVPSPARGDDGLRITGNVIWNGPADHPSGFGQGCSDANPTCNETLFRSSNWVNTVEPRLVDPVGGDWRPAPGGALSALSGVPFPAWDWTGDPSGSGPLSPTDPGRDRAGLSRPAGAVPGAYLPG